MSRIVLFGATGYTGRLVAAALLARGADPVLAARDRKRTEALAGELAGDGPPPEVAEADVHRPETVRALVDRGDVLVSTVGPFARWGAAAVEAAIDAGAHYLDSTGEPGFIRDVFHRWGPRALVAEAALVPAFGYDWVPGNLAGALALRDGGDAVTRLDIGYFVTGSVGPGSLSGGTRASAAGVLGAPGTRGAAGGWSTRRRPATTGPTGCAAGPVRAERRRLRAPRAAPAGARAAGRARAPGLVRAGGPAGAGAVPGSPGCRGCRGWSSRSAPACCPAPPAARTRRPGAAPARTCRRSAPAPTVGSWPGSQLEGPNPYTLTGDLLGLGRRSGPGTAG